MNQKIEFEAVIIKAPDIDGAYVEFPYDVKATFGKGRMPVHAIFDWNCRTAFVVLKNSVFL